jgi:cob(I)alamin adenosyltransferase
VDYWVVGQPRFNRKTKQFRFGVLDCDRKSGEQGLVVLRQLFSNKKYDLVILDEINSSLALGIVAESDFLKVLKVKPAKLELVLTGRAASPKILRQANLITEMKVRKHYYAQGVKARPGIEY